MSATEPPCICGVMGTMTTMTTMMNPMTTTMSVKCPGRGVVAVELECHYSKARIEIGLGHEAGQTPSGGG